MNNMWQWYQGLPPMQQQRVREVLLHEARGEGVPGMGAAGQTLYNRIIGRPEKSLEWHTAPSRFENFQFGGRQYTPEQHNQATEALQRGAPEIGNATHYYANRGPNAVRPYWAPEMTDSVQMGNHIFGHLNNPARDPYIAGLRQRGPVPGFSDHAKQPMPLMQPPPQQLPAVQDMPQLQPVQPGLLAPAAAPAVPELVAPLASAGSGIMGSTPFDFMGAIRRGFGILS